MTILEVVGSIVNLHDHYISGIKPIRDSAELLASRSHWKIPLIFTIDFRVVLVDGSTLQIPRGPTLPSHGCFLEKDEKHVSCEPCLQQHPGELARGHNV